MNTNGDWQEFQGRGALHFARQEPTVSISPKGTIGLNQAAYVALGEPERVSFAFNRADNRLIRIRGAQTREPGTSAVKKQKTARSYQINAGAFLRHIGYTAPTHAFTPRVEEGGVLFVDLHS